MTEESNEQGQGQERNEQCASSEEPRAFVAARTIVLQVLRNDHDEHRTRTELLEVVSDIDPAIVTAELRRLAVEGAVIVDGEQVAASPCARCLDDLDLIGV